MEIIVGGEPKSIERSELDVMTALTCMPGNFRRQGTLGAGVSGEKLRGEEFAHRRKGRHGRRTNKLEYRNPKFEQIQTGSN